MNVWVCTYLHFNPSNATGTLAENSIWALFQGTFLNLFDQTLLQEIPMERTRMWLGIQTRFINETDLKRAKVFSFRPLHILLMSNQEAVSLQPI